MFPIFAGNSAATGYNLTRSIRTRASASGYLNRTPATTTNQKTWTWSGWVKRGTLGQSGGSSPFFFNSSSAGTDATFFACGFNGDALTVTGYLTNYLTTSAVYRDTAAWYHVVIAVDTTQATTSNRIKVYVNGSQVTAFSTANYVAQNFNTPVNLNQAHYFSAYNIGVGVQNFNDLYLAEVNFVDGLQLTPSSFGSTNATTGVWQPARYTGSYGTNGFYLPFTDNSALTTSSNVGLGKDFSGNGNYWTTNNISITAGVTYDSMTDVPTLTSASAANYPTLNPLNSVGSSYLYAANLSRNGGDNYTISTMGMPSGKWYAEVTITTVGTESSCGIATAADISGAGVGNNAWSWGYLSGARKYNNGSSPSYGSAFANGDIVGIAFDNTAGSLEFYLNGVSQGVAFSGLAAGTYFFAVEGRTSGTPNNCSINFGQRPFSYTPPTGYVSLNTYNLPTSTILAGNKYMDVSLWTGNSTGSTTQTITNSGGMKPDFLWGKSRSAAYDHNLIDSVRGVSKILYSDLTNAEATNANALSSFNSNGFTVGTDAGGLNDNGKTFVGWQWQAGQGSSSSNTNGTITSTVSVNASAGFSVCTFTNAASGTQTFGHGLGVAPALVIIKGRSAVGSWPVYHQSLGNTAYVFLNQTAASATAGTIWDNTSPTSTVVTMGNITGFWGASVTCVAYCWTPIAGYSSFGSFTGNGSTDGPFIYTGFRPKFIIYKCSSATGGWLIADTARGTYNLNDPYLTANTSDAEATGNFIDILSNGFKFRATSGTGINGSGQTYIYMAFAENPLKYSLAR